jgi:hypothetical protein
VSAPAPDATNDYSTGSRAARTLPQAPSAPRAALAGLAVLAAVLLVASTFLTLLRITAGDATVASRSGLDHHSVSMLLLGVATLPMALGSLRGARPAMAALAVLGAAVLVVALTVDLPAALDDGLYGDRFEGAEAEPAIGFYAETLAGALLMLSGGLLLLLPREALSDYHR